MFVGDPDQKWREIQRKGTKKFPAGTFFNVVDDGTYDFNGQLQRGMIDVLKKAEWQNIEETTLYDEDIDKTIVISSKDRMEIEKVQNILNSGDYSKAPEIRAIKVDDKLYVISGHETYIAREISGDVQRVKIVDASDLAFEKSEEVDTKVSKPLDIPEVDPRFEVGFIEQIPPLQTPGTFTNIPIEEEDEE